MQVTSDTYVVAKTKEKCYSQNTWRLRLFSKPVKNIFSRQTYMQEETCN